MENNVVASGMVVSLDYTLTVDGEIVDSSGDQPLEYLQGYHNIIPGLEKALEGMLVGDSKDVQVAPEEAYGLRDAQAIYELPRTQFPPNFPVEIGRDLRVRSDSGQILNARICEVGDEIVKIDTNHPLAGKSLLFSTKISALRPATDQELANGGLYASSCCGSGSCGDDSCGSGGCGSEGSCCH
jgi:FKBP-type peptidyl-prolyl cis-trans isomerase SlyD